MIDKLLSRLDKVRRLSDSRYMARCPAHNDRTPSLVVSQADDKVLFHCYAGCTPDEILTAVGLKWSDLYADPYEASFQAACGSSPRRQVDPLEVDKNVLLIVQNMLESGKTLSAEDEARAQIALENVMEARVND